MTSSLVKRTAWASPWATCTPGRPAALKRTAIDPADVLAALKNWKPEVEDDEAEDDEAEPRGADRSGSRHRSGHHQAPHQKALKKLEADGFVEKLSGRPARYVTTGDAA